MPFRGPDLPAPCSWQPPEPPPSNGMRRPPVLPASSALLTSVVGRAPASTALISGPSAAALSAAPGAGVGVWCRSAVAVSRTSGDFRSQGRAAGPVGQEIGKRQFEVQRRHRHVRRRAPAEFQAPNGRTDEALFERNRRPPPPPVRNEGISSSTAGREERASGAGRRSVRWRVLERDFGETLSSAESHRFAQSDATRQQRTRRLPDAAVRQTVVPTAAAAAAATRTSSAESGRSRPSAAVRSIASAESTSAVRVARSIFSTWFALRDAAVGSAFGTCRRTACFSSQCSTDLRQAVDDRATAIGRRWR
jgi:hypothetical protein